MKRILMMVFRNILLVPYMWIKLCYHASHVDKYTEEEHYKMLGFITVSYTHLDVYKRQVKDRSTYFLFNPFYSSTQRRLRNK